MSPASGGRVAPVSVTDYDPIGYRLQVDHRIGQKLLVAVDAESRPFFYDSIGARWNDPVLGGIDGPLYVSDGGASVRDLTLSLQGRLGPWADWTVGSDRRTGPRPGRGLDSRPRLPDGGEAGQ